MDVKQIIEMSGMTVEEMETMFQSLMKEARMERVKEITARRAAEHLEKAAGALNKIRRVCGD